MRRLVCRILGHDWVNVRSWDVTTWPVWWCRRCGADRRQVIR